MQALKRMFPLYVFSLAVVLAVALLGSRTVTALAEVFEAQTPAPPPTVILDPGHGGEDGGAVSPGGVLESGVNLSIALRTRDLLTFLGVPVAMTREEDVSLCDPAAGSVSARKVSDLKNRVRLAAETEDPNLVGIHQNMFPEAKYRGAQVFYAAAPGSRALAERLQASLCADLDPTNHRQAKQSQSVYLMDRITCPGVLVECGFLSNPGEEALLQTEAYQKKLAAVLAAGLTREIEARSGT